MEEITETGVGERPRRPYGRPGVTAAEINAAADALLREGLRPTVERIRARLGRGSPNTINPLLDEWWKTLGARLDSGPAALHRLPEAVAHVAEALWMQALDEARRRMAIEIHGKESDLERQTCDIEVRSHVLTLREGELESRLRDRDHTVRQLEAQIVALTTILRTEQASRESNERRAVQRAQAPELVRVKRARPPHLALRKSGTRQRKPLSMRTNRKSTHEAKRAVKPKRSRRRQRPAKRRPSRPMRGSRIPTRPRR
jgi:hypothetical protein